MALDLIDAHGLGDVWHLIEIAGVIPQIGIVGDPPQVALEVAVIDAVEPHQRSEQPPVRLGSLSSHQIALPRKPLLKLVERLENTAGGFFISLLGGRETGAINAVVYGWIDNFVDGIDLGA